MTLHNQILWPFSNTIKGNIPGSSRTSHQIHTFDSGNSSDASNEYQTEASLSLDQYLADESPEELDRKQTSIERQPSMSITTPGLGEYLEANFPNLYEAIENNILHPNNEGDEYDPLQQANQQQELIRQMLPQRGLYQCIRLNARIVGSHSNKSTNTSGVNPKDLVYRNQTVAEAIQENDLTEIFGLDDFDDSDDYDLQDPEYQDTIAEYERAILYARVLIPQRRTERRESRYNKRKAI